MCRDEMIYYIHKPFAPILVVLSAWDPGNGHRRWDRYRLDHEAQDRSHAVSGRSWILTGRAANNAGKFYTRGCSVFERNLFSLTEILFSFSFVFCV